MHTVLCQGSRLAYYLWLDVVPHAQAIRHIDWNFPGMCRELNVY
jgi:hypothetical protein